ncbi:MAG: Maf family nucleotide pyrophosphatase [Chitinophagaceae bacterium]
MAPFFSHKLLLASQSPRRQQLLRDSGFELELIKIDVEEDFPETLVAEQIPLYLAEKKGKAYNGIIKDNELLVTADTVVWLKDQVLNKPADLDDAFDMLKRLSGHKHTVYTGVSVRSANKQISFYEASDVFFNTLSDDMIRYYLDNHQPLDKAGAYGIQEFIGYVGIRKIDGCYYNVMGFPVSRFIHEIQHL